MIPLSPLQLKQHFFTVISLKAAAKPAKDGKPNLEPTVGCMADPKLANHWRLSLHIKLESASLERRLLLAYSKNAPPATPEMMEKANELIGKVFRGESLDAPPNKKS